MSVHISKLLLILCLVLAGQNGWADESDVEIEASQSGSTSASQSESQVSDQLGDLEPYKNIAVIQKKFFPKTERWEVFVSGFGSLNNKLFTSLGGKAHVGYHFSERWAVEGQLWFSGQIGRDFTDDIETRYAITSSDLSTPQGYLGVNLLWSPIYGKLSLFEKTIDPFELYFSFGGGLILTDDSQTVPSLHGAIGQVHPVSTKSTIRWEIGGNLFQAKGKKSLVGASRGKKVMSELIYFSIGMSFYFPEVERR